MKSNVKMLIAAVVILAVLVGGYFVAVKWQPDDKNESSAENGTQQTGEVDYLINEKIENVESVTFSTGEISYSVYPGDKIRIEGYSSNVLDEGKLSSAAYSATTIVASHKMEKQENLEKFGLDKDDKYVSVKLKSGKEQKLIIGNPAKIDGEYYVKMSDSDEVYTITSYTAEALLKHPDAYRDLSIAEIDNTAITMVSIGRGSEKLLEFKLDEEYEPTNEYQTVSYLVTYPYNNIKANLDSITPLFEAISSVQGDSIVEENPSELSKYGLDNPFTLTVKDMNATSVIKMGDYADDGSVYVMKDGVDVVYKAQCSFYENVKNIKASEFIERFIHLYNIADVKSITVKNSKESHTLEIIKKSEDDFEYKIDGKYKVKENFTPVYSKIIGVTASEYPDISLEGTEKCSIDFKLADGNSKSFTYYEYDERNCVVKADNGLVCLVSTKSIDDIFASLK